jgi:mannitol 2-dehydrogenase
MKIRLLNAGHSTLGIPGAIHGHPTIDQCMNDEVFRDFLRAFMDTEVTPVLGKIEGIDVEKYKDTLEERFANANIKDSVSRICSESSAKLPKFLIPTIQENLENGGHIQYATFLLAAWCYYSDKGQDENGQAIEIFDAQKDELHEASKHTESNWTNFLQLRDIFGDLTENEIFIKEYTHHVQAIYKEKNIRKLMRQLLA